MRTIVLLTLALAVAGCAQRQTIAQECTNIGAGPGTSGYRDCYLRLRQVDATISAGVLASPDPAPVVRAPR